MAENKNLREEIKTIQDQLAKVTTLLETKCNTMVNNNSIITNNITQVTLRPWSNDGGIVIPTNMLRTAFTENNRLAEYCQMSDIEKAEIRTAETYVLEALMDLVKRVHDDPAARNVYLNPKRSDQVLVFDELKWKTETLAGATRTLFDSVAGGVRKIIYKEIHTDEELTTQLKGTACFVPQLYDQEPERFIKKARAPMAAHLTNTTPTKSTEAEIK